MRLFIFLSALSTLLLSTGDCSKKNDTPRLKGRLEVAGMCMNYTIAVLEGNLEPGRVEPVWTDETTGIQYQQVFRLENPCDFPSSIKQGDVFYFTPVTASSPSCMVCLAYYPTPAKKMSIKVIQ